MQARLSWEEVDLESHTLTLSNTRNICSFALMFVAAIVGCLLHAGSTALFAIFLASFGKAILSSDNYWLVSTGILLCFGAYYLLTFFAGRRDSCCESKCLKSQPQQIDHSSAGSLPSPRIESDQEQTSKRTTLTHVDVVNSSSAAAASSLLSLMAFSPCIGSMPILLSLASSNKSPVPLVVGTLVLFLSSAVVMCAFVTLSYIGVERLYFAQLRPYERLMIGLCLLGLAVFAYFTQANHDHHSDAHGRATHTSVLDGLSNSASAQEGISHLQDLSRQGFGRCH